jgi:crotonobetainyl-CoA:carnitine CoA-transferase CaiB-like acyl-CoA transferase
MSDPREDSRGGSLAGLLVVSIEQAVAAPLCTVRLADAGARVIKIESRISPLAQSIVSGFPERL